MSDVLDFESRDVPGPVAIAGMIGIAKAIFEGGFGLLGLAVADSVDDSFGGGLLAFGIVFAIASLLLLRGNRVGYYLTVALSAVGLVIGVVYLFQAESASFGAAIVIAFSNALVLYLLLGRKSARDFFTRAS
jgi:uncharacterized membrane protein (UPF0136 family)